MPEPAAGNSLKVQGLNNEASTARNGAGPTAVNRARRPALCRNTFATLLAALLPALAFPQANTSAPVIDSLTAAPATVKPGETLTLTVEAHDPDCTTGVCTTGCGAYVRGDLTYWSTVGGTFGSFVKIAPGTPGSTATGSQSPYVGQAVWTAPTTEGAYTISVSLGDSGGFMCGGRKTTSTSIPIQVSLITNEPPAVTAVTAVPGRVFPGDEAVLGCEASDPDGDALTLSWSSDLGSVTGSDASASFVATSPGLATVTCTATDVNGGVGTGTAQISVTDAMAETSITPNLYSPQRVAADSMGSLYVADASSGGLAVVNFFSKELVYRLPIARVASVAVDWADRLLVGGKDGARVLTRDGELVFGLDPGEALGPVADVAVDTANQRYGVLYAQARRVVLFDLVGARVGAIVSGAGDAELRRPVSLAFTPTGRVVVADNGLARLKVFDASGSLVVAFGGSGSAAGKFVQLAGVAVDANGVIYATDAFQSWLQTFNPDGTLREVLGAYGDDVGRFRTPAGLVASEHLRRLVVTSLNSSSLQVFRMKGEALTPALPQASLSAATLTFLPQAVGTTSQTQGVTLTNGGTAPLGIRSVTVSGDFLETHDCGKFLDPGQTCRFSVSFSPMISGTATGELVIDTSAENGRRIVSLFGEGVFAPSIALSPSSLLFGGQVVGTTSAALPVLLTNTGGASLAIAGFRVSGPFGFSSACGSLVPAGTSCTLDVSFTPQAAGTALGSLAVDSNAASGISSVTLGGTGLSASVSLDPASVDFGRQKLDTAAKPVKIDVTNIGETPLAIGLVAIEGSGAAAFTLEQDACGGRVLASAESCHVRVGFEPTEAGSFSARLRLDTDAAEGAVFAELAGIGDTLGGDLLFEATFESGDLSAWTLVVTPAASSMRPPVAEAPVPVSLRVDFGPVAVAGPPAVRTLMVVNGGSEALLVEPLALTGTQAAEFTLRDDLCGGLRLEAGASCTFGVAFSPTAVHAAGAEILVQLSGAQGASGTFVLAGAGIPAESQP